jgi:glycosyltransferase involved in cell wall biosynthesis
MIHGRFGQEIRRKTTPYHERRNDGRLPAFPAEIELKRRLAIVVSHPIQHFCPLYRAWAASKHWHIRVFFASRAGAEPYFDANFGRQVNWNSLGLDRFEHEFLNGDRMPPINRNIDAVSLDAALSSFDPYAVLSYGYNQRLQRRAQSWASRHGRQLLFFSDAESRHHRPLWQRLAKQVLLPRLLKPIDRFITVGDANEEYYRQFGVPATKFVRGPFPIDRDAYATAHALRAELRRSTRESLGIGEAEFVAAIVGKLVSWKRQGDLIEAMGRMDGAPAVALVIGSGATLAGLRHLAARQGRNRTVFAGFVDAHALAAYYAAADVYVHASSKEPHSLAVSEAAFMGLPVVVSDRCGSYGTDDDVRPGVNGLVYRCGDVDALRRLLSWLRDNPSRRLDMGMNSHRIASAQQSVTYDHLLGTLAVLADLRG